MAPTLDVGGGSGLVAVNRGLRTCTSGGLLWAWWVRSWAVVNIVLAGFVTFGSFGLLGYDVLVVSSGVVGGFVVVVGHGFLIKRKQWETFEFLDLMILFGFENFGGFGLFFLLVFDPIFFVFVSQEDLWV